MEENDKMEGREEERPNRADEAGQGDEQKDKWKKLKHPAFVISAFAFVLLMSAFFIFRHCSNKAEKEACRPQPCDMKTESKEQAGDEKNVQPGSSSSLDNLTYSGFGYKQIRPPKAKRTAWMDKNLAEIKKVIKELPAGSLLILKGHASSEKSSDKQITISQYGLGMLRAQFLYKLLDANNIPMDKIKCKSAGDKEPMPGTKKSDPANRRVTVYIEKK